MTQPASDPEPELRDGDIIRAKWIMDGAATLGEAAGQVRALADRLDTLHRAGYTLEHRIEDDYAYIRRPPSEVELPQPVPDHGWPDPDLPF